MSETGGSLRKLKKQRTYEAAGHAAVRLIAERGIHSVRVEDICERAQISKATFFRYFDSKETCFIAGLQHGRLDAVIAALTARPPDEAPFTALCNAFYDITADWGRHRKVMLMESRVRAEAPAVQARANAEYVTWEQALATTLQQRSPAAEEAAPPLELRLVAGVVLCSVRLANERWLEEGAVRSPAGYYFESFSKLAGLVEEAPDPDG